MGAGRLLFLLILFILAAAMSGCASRPNESPSVLPTQFAATPEPLEPEESPSTSPTSTRTSSVASTSTAPTTTSATAAPFRVRTTLSDPAGDAGLQSPDYADLIRLMIESDATDARVTVDVAASLPATLNPGEVMGIGVDLYKNASSPESDYQLFATGGEDGWFAYLQTPSGFVDYPGSFRLGAGRIVFQVPLSSLGGLSATSTSTFLDWSEGGQVINAAGSDRVPDSGRGTIQP